VNSHQTTIGRVMMLRGGQVRKSRATIEPIQRAKISDAVAERLQVMIEQSVYKVGDKLPPERVLVEQFGVGRTSIREALRTMEATGLVEIRHGLGVVVVRSEPAGQRDFLELGGYTVHDLLDVRELIETKAAALAAERSTPEEVEDIGRIVHRMEDPEVTDDEYATLDADLHRTLVMAAANPLLTRLYETLQQPFLDYSRRMLRIPERRHEADTGHAKILIAMESGSPELAEQAIREHLETVRQQLASYLAQQDAEGEGAALKEDAQD
jgi:GntR family transcriptional regulator, transcriptional repressor for pyruvate dehydrogenase complex